jgi:hypothetical protein
MINNNSMKSMPYLRPSWAFLRRSLHRLIDNCGWPFYASRSVDLSFELILINNFSPYASSCLFLSSPSLFASRAKHKEFKYATCTMLADGAKDKSSKRPQTCNGLYEIAEHCADKLWQICIMKWKIAYLFKLLLLIFAHSRWRFRSSSLGNFSHFFVSNIICRLIFFRVTCECWIYFISFLLLWNFWDILRVMRTRVWPSSRYEAKSLNSLKMCIEIFLIASISPHIKPCNDSSSIT